MTLHLLLFTLLADGKRHLNESQSELDSKFPFIHSENKLVPSRLKEPAQFFATHWIQVRRVGLGKTYGFFMKAYNIPCCFSSFGPYNAYKRIVAHQNVILIS